jgi:endonuclease YncB( thermonuclease family)
VAKVRLKGEWKLWAGIGIILLAVVIYLYVASRPPMEGGEYLWQVTKVADDNTLRLKGSGKTIEFRLIGMDVPKLEAGTVRQLLTETLGGKWVRIKTLREKPKAGIKEGFVFLSGEDILARLVRQGLVQVDRNEKGFDVRPYIELELEAKRAKRGLWGQSAPGVK